MTFFLKDVDEEIRPVPAFFQPRPDFQHQIIGFVLGFSNSSCFSKLELSVFILVPVLELFRTSWFRSDFWKPTFVCSLILTPCDMIMVMEMYRSPVFFTLKGPYFFL